MNRRDFLKSAAAAGVGAAATGAPLISQPSEAAARQRRKATDPRKYWIWSGPRGGDDEAKVKAEYRSLRARGLTGIFFSGGLNEMHLNAMKEAGLDVHIWMWTTNRGDGWIRENHPDWFMVSRSGKSCFDQPPYVGYYRWISPALPAVQRYIEEKVDELAVHPLVDGVHLDYVRYPDVILPDALWSTYDVDQTEELPDYDFCYSEHTRKAFQEVSGRDPLEIEDPAHDQEWLHFRYDTVTNLVKRCKAVTTTRGKQLTAAVFPTPRLARKICRQDWERWPMDAVAPMIYNSFYNEPVEWIGDCMRENIHAVDFPVYAGLYMPALGEIDDFREAIRLTHKRGGAGVSIFGGISDAHWDAFTEEVS